MDNMCLQYATAYSLNRDETSLVILHATDIKRRLVQAWRTLSLSTVVLFGPPENPSEMTLSSLLELERVTDPGGHTMAVAPTQEQWAQSLETGSHYSAVADIAMTSLCYNCDIRWYRFPMQVNRASSQGPYIFSGRVRPYHEDATSSLHTINLLTCNFADEPLPHNQLPTFNLNHYDLLLQSSSVLDFERALQKGSWPDDFQECAVQAHTFLVQARREQEAVATAAAAAAAAAAATVPGEFHDFSNIDPTSGPQTVTGNKQATTSDGSQSATSSEQSMGMAPSKRKSTKTRDLVAHARNTKLSGVRSITVGDHKYLRSILRDSIEDMILDAQRRADAVSIYFLALARIYLFCTVYLII
jgi:hypothetical protein